MKVEIWSDVVCPWCYIGKRRLEAALVQFEQRDEVDVIWRSFELDPAAPRRREGTRAEHLARKYGWSPAQAAASDLRLTTVAGELGLDFHLDETAGGNTFDAHRLLHLARETGRQDALKERFLRAYFSEGQAVGEPDVLEQLAAEAGIDRADARLVLAGDRFADAVRDDERRARLLGINGVPFFAVDETYGISGAQPTELMLSALEQAWAETHPKLVRIAGAGGACDGESCEV